MIPIQIRMLCGAATGRVRVFDQPELSFGRTPDNTIVIESPHASRQHGALICDEHGWHVLNASPNGTTVNGKPVGKKNIILKNGDTIGVAGQPLFSVEILLDAAPEEPDQTPFSQNTFAPAAESLPGAANAGGPKRSKMWIGLGGYLAGMLILFVILKLVLGGGANGDKKEIPPLTPDMIAATITKPITMSKDDKIAGENLFQARELYQRAEADPTSLYQAYSRFKKAEAASGGTIFQEGDGPLFYREYKKSEQELITLISKTYLEGYMQLQAGQAKNAIDTFQLLLRLYPDSQSEIFVNTTQLLAKAKRKSAR